MSDYDPRRKLRAMFPSAPGEYKFSSSDAISMMVLTRELLEKTKKMDKYPTLNMFCNWTVHTELEGSISAYKILSAVSDILLSTDDPNRRAQLISQELSSAKLRQEIISLYRINRISTHIFESAASWTMFGRHFFKAILDKRLRYPSNPASNPRSSAIYNAMLEKVGSRLDKVAISLRMQTDDTGEERRISWVVECFDGHEERGSYLNLEHDPDFANPSFWEGKVAFIQEPPKPNSAS